jgi:GT2 family glycosyltransferase
LKANVLILNWNGADLLRRYLPSFTAAAARASTPCVITVVDNASSDNSEAVVRSFGGAVKWMRMRENRVLCSYNDAAAVLTEDVLVFMNNDIEVDPGFLDPLVRPFKSDRDVFFVTPRCLASDRRTYEGNRTCGRVRYGVYWSTALFPGYEQSIDRPGPTIAGGFGAFDRQKFLALDGYDDLYLPGRLEDTDICLRAQKKGWKCLYAPESVVYHQGGVSFHKHFGLRRTLVINWRNTFLFMWKNLSAKTLAVSFLWLPARFLYSLLTLKPELFMGFVEALPLVPQALARRRALKRGALAELVREEEIFERVK